MIPAVAMRTVRVREFALTLAALALCACSDHGASADGTNGGGGSGAGAGTSAGSSGAKSGSGGGGGSAGFPMCPAGTPMFGTSDIDVTSGGLNADLPAPSQDCLTVSPGTSMCAALSLEIAGKQREIVCTSPSTSASDGSAFNCSAGSEAVSVNTSHFGNSKPPATFSFGLDVESQPLTLTLKEGNFGGFNGPAATTARVDGWVNLYYDDYGCNDTMFGVIAATFAEGDAGTGMVRARGSFQARQFFH